MVANLIRTMAFMIGCTLLSPLLAEKTEAQSQSLGSCRAVPKPNGALRFQECNDFNITGLLTITHASLGDVHVEFDLGSSDMMNLHCVGLSGTGKAYAVISKDNPNIDSIFAILLNAHEKRRPIKNIRFKKPTSGTLSVCTIESVTSNL